MGKAMSKTANTHVRTSNYKSRLPNTRKYKPGAGYELYYLPLKLGERPFVFIRTWEQAIRWTNVIGAYNREWFKCITLADIPVLKIKTEEETCNDNKTVDSAGDTHSGMASTNDILHNAGGDEVQRTSVLPGKEIGPGCNNKGRMKKHRNGICRRFRWRNGK